MSYEVELSEAAEEAFLGLPTWLQAPVERHLEALGRSPTTHARRSVSPPYPPGRMMSEFEVSPTISERHHVVILFRYGADEMSLLVEYIGHQKL